MTATAETRTFAAACLLDPWDDTPRLVMADWLDEHGQEDRAELVRVQIRLSRPPWNSRDMIREKDILSRHTGDSATGERWDRVKCEKCKGKGRVRGDGSEFGYGDGCPTCGGSGNLCVREVVGDEDTGVLDEPRPLHWDRGFLHLGCQIAEAVEERECPVIEKCPECRGRGGFGSPRKNCRDCNGNGRIITDHILVPTLTPWSRAVLEAGCGLWLEGVEPWRESGKYHLTCERYGETGAVENVPNWLYDQLCPTIAAYISFPSSSAAKLELARAFTAWAARQEKESA